MTARSMARGLPLALLVATCTTMCSASSVECSGNEDMFFAARTGNLELAEACMGTVPHDARDEAGCTPLIVAALNGHMDIVKQQLRHGARLDATCDSGRSAQRYAEEGRDVAMEEFLRSAHMCTKKEWFGAARDGDWRAIRRCRVAGFNVDERDEAGCPAVVTAVINGRKDAVATFHEIGADLEASCASGTTALMHAARVGDAALVDYLRLAGVDTEREMGREKWTALTHAARHGRMAVAKMLHKLDAELGTYWTGTALMWAAAVGDVGMISEFVKRDDLHDIHARDEHGHTAALWAAHQGNLEALQKLVNAGASLNVATHSGWTPLMAAAYGGHHSTVVYLMRHRTKVDELDKAGWSAMMWASANNHVEVVDYLINSGGSVEPREGDWNPLMVAAASGSDAVLDLLLQRGIDFTDVNHESKSAATLARENGFVDMADRLDRMTAIRRRHEDL